MLHRVFTEAELATAYTPPEQARTHPEIAKFIGWIRKKPAEYLDWPKAFDAARRAGKGRRPAGRL